MIEWALIFMLLDSNGEPVRVVESRATETACRAAIKNIGQGGLFKANIDGADVDAKLLYCAWARDGKYEDYVRP